MTAEALRVEIRDGSLVLSIPVDTLAFAIQASPALSNWSVDGKKWLFPQVTDAAEFAKAVVAELNREQEDGTTPVHLLLDNAAREAIEQGAEGVEIPEGWNPR